MNVVEHFIVEIHSEKDDVIEGFVEVDVTVNCYGNISRVKHSTSKRQWEIDKKNGYYMA
ncbi:MAG: hypothetical protein IKB64_02275 [Paludibacteraceae bacterium]|nr:hypothetical protein [Paludibacteraceae bacterium]